MKVEVLQDGAVSPQLPVFMVNSANLHIKP